MGLKRLLNKIADYIDETAELNKAYYDGKAKKRADEKAKKIAIENEIERARKTAIENAKKKQVVHDKNYGLIQKPKEEPAPSANTQSVQKQEETAKPVAVIARTDTRPNDATIHVKERTPQTAPPEGGLRFPDWYITISFGKSTSYNYQKALYMAKNAPQYTEYEHNGMLIHQAIYSGERSEFLQFRVLYEMIRNWKSTHIFINGEIAMPQAVSAVLSCYEWKCHSSNPYYCYNLQNPKNNPFPCHYIDISKWHNPFWTFYLEKGRECILDEKRLKETIDRAAVERRCCPAFDYENMMQIFNDLPRRISRTQFEVLVDESGYGYYSR